MYLKLEIMAAKQKHKLLSGKNKTHTFFPQNVFETSYFHIPFLLIIPLQ